MLTIEIPPATSRVAGPNITTSGLASKASTGSLNDITRIQSRGKRATTTQTPTISQMLSRRLSGSRNSLLVTHHS